MSSSQNHYMSNSNYSDLNNHNTGLPHILGAIPAKVPTLRHPHRHDSAESNCSTKSGDSIRSILSTSSNSSSNSNSSNSSNASNSSNSSNSSCSGSNRSSPKSPSTSPSSLTRSIITSNNRCDSNYSNNYGQQTGHSPRANKARGSARVPNNPNGTIRVMAGGNTIANCVSSNVIGSAISSNVNGNNNPNSPSAPSTPISSNPITFDFETDNSNSTSDRNVYYGSVQTFPVQAIGTLDLYSDEDGNANGLNGPLSASTLARYESALRLVNGLTVDVAFQLLLAQNINQQTAFQLLSQNIQEQQVEGGTGSVIMYRGPNHSQSAPSSPKGNNSNSMTMSCDDDIPSMQRASSLPNYGLDSKTLRRQTSSPMIPVCDSPRRKGVDGILFEVEEVNELESLRVIYENTKENAKRRWIPMVRSRED